MTLPINFIVFVSTFIIRSKSFDNLCLIKFAKFRLPISTFQNLKNIIKLLDFQFEYLGNDSRNFLFLSEI